MFLITIRRVLIFTGQLIFLLTYSSVPQNSRQAACVNFRLAERMFGVMSQQGLCWCSPSHGSAIVVIGSTSVYYPSFMPQMDHKFVIYMYINSLSEEFLR